MKLNDQLRSEMTADELAVLDGKPIAPEAEFTETDQEPAAEPEAESTDEAAPAAEPAAPELAAEEAAAEPEAVEAEAPALPQYDVATTDFKAARDVIKSERREVETKWSSGELTDEERAEKLEQLQDKADDLLIQQTRAATLAEANTQAEKRAIQQRVDSENAAMRNLAQREAELLKAGKPALDYAKDTLAQSQFDMMFSAVKANPANAGLSVAQQVDEAHKAVRALRGLIQAPTTTKPKPVIPQTLGNLPSAAVQPVGADLAEQLAAIDDPDALEAKWASLPTNQRAAMLRATLPTRSRR